MLASVDEPRDMLYLLDVCEAAIIVAILASGVTMEHIHSDSRDFISGCCNGTLGYARSKPYIPCWEMKCCNSSETVAIIPVDYALGYRFRCMAKRSIRPQCYDAGVEVRSSNENADFTPRVCCEGAKFEIILNQWYAAMTIKCIFR